jgi:hypothetical protein
MFLDYKGPTRSFRGYNTFVHHTCVFMMNFVQILIQLLKASESALLNVRWCCMIGSLNIEE